MGSAQTRHQDTRPAAQLPRPARLFVAALGHLQPQALMTAADFERAPVEVDFAK